jgi:hypothetical protein
MVYGNAKQLNQYCKTQNWGTYLQHGNSSLFFINTGGFSPDFPLWTHLTSFLSMLQTMGIISSGLDMRYQVTIHEIKLRFDIEIPGAIFCKTGRFLKLSDTVYRSDDTRKYLRKSGYYDEKESKGIQQSFVTVIQRREDSSVILAFSGKYRKHISPEFLCLSNEELIHCLCKLGSVYLTQATDPEAFIIARGYVKYLPVRFRSLLKDANWYDGNFSRRNITTNFLGGVLL